MKKYDIENIPVMSEDGQPIGSISEQGLFQKMFGDQDLRGANIEAVMEPAYPLVELNSPVEKLGKLITKENGAVLVKDEQGNYHIVTKYDIIQSMAQ
jgi:cystathionine beta-synthase